MPTVLSLLLVFCRKRRCVPQRESFLFADSREIRVRRKYTVLSKVHIIAAFTQAGRAGCCSPLDFTQTQRNFTVCRRRPWQTSISIVVLSQELECVGYICILCKLFTNDRLRSGSGAIFCVPAIFSLDIILIVAFEKT